MPSALLNLGTVGVSNAAFLFITPFVERCGTGVFGTIPSSLYPLTAAHYRLQSNLHAKHIITLRSTSWRSVCAPLVHAADMRFTTRFSLEHFL